MRILIADDRLSGQAALSALLRGRKDIERVDAAHLGSDTLAKLRGEAYDVVLVDVGAPATRVCAILKALRSIPGPVPSLMVVRARGDKALERLASGSVSSPQGSAWIGDTLDVVAHRPAPDLPRLGLPPSHFEGMQFAKIGIKRGGRILFVDPRQVISVEARGSYVCLQGLGWVHVLRGTISSMAEMLKGLGFVRIHRSALVNPAFVREIKPYSTGQYGLRLEGDREYRVTRKYKENLGALAALWIGADFTGSVRRRRRESHRGPHGWLRKSLATCSQSASGEPDPP